MPNFLDHSEAETPLYMNSHHEDPLLGFGVKPRCPIVMDVATMLAVIASMLAIIQTILETLKVMRKVKKQLKKLIRKLIRKPRGRTIR